MTIYSLPVIQGTPQGSGTAEGTTHAFSMPVGVVAGEWLVAGMTFNGGIHANPPSVSLTITSLDGWNLVHGVEGGDTGASPQWWAKLADGTEGASETWTTAINAVGAAVVYRLDDQSPLSVDGLGLLTSGIDVSTGTWSPSDPDNNGFLSIACEAYADTGASGTGWTAPSGYTLDVNQASSAQMTGTSAYARIVTAHKVIASGDTENPGAWGGSDGTGYAKYAGALLIRYAGDPSEPVTEPYVFRLTRRRRKVNVRELPHAVSREMVGALFPEER